MNNDINSTSTATIRCCESDNIKSILARSIEAGASDLHINAEMRPIMRINTRLTEMDCPEISNASAAKMLLEMLGPERFDIFKEKLDYDFSTTLEDGNRFRVNAHFQRDTIAISFRAIANEIPDIENLFLPPVVKELTTLPRGLVVVTGHTGSGKSTTLAAMIGQVNENYNKHIITLEDPIEYAFTNKKSIIEQREMGSDCSSFSSGLRHVLRQDPDVILVGEMRDLETASSTITAAETGHLVLSTLHTVNAAQTVERIIDIYPASQQNQIRAMLSNTLQAVISQTLFKRIDKPGMVPCVEILLCNSAVRNCIRENRIYEIHNIISTSRKLGMQDLDYSIAQMYFNGFVDRDEAVVRSSNPQKMEKLLQPQNRAEFLQNQAALNR
ncbi:MAG: PilT/PilU family type 4a pilus ATPase [Anaerohalosphaeraceae bacterium]|nr:PilT/PilU family type 4a pilus ATPase [Anaerohalosphaeraceae bacterium]